MHVCLYAHVFQSKAAPVLGFTDMIPGYKALGATKVCRAWSEEGTAS